MAVLPEAWEKAAVIADSAAAFGIVAALFYSVWSFRTTLRDSYYAELDRVYFDLLRIGMEHPELVDFPTSHDRSKSRQYDAYAFMIWNFVETVFDRCQGWGWSKRRLRDTWYPVIAAENARHRDWFNLPQNRSKFKAPFCRFIDARYPMPQPVKAPPKPVDLGGAHSSPR